LFRRHASPAARSVEIVGDAPVSVAVVGSRAEADLVVGMLRSNGVAAYVSADDAGGQDPALQLFGVRVMVAPSDEAEARRLLADIGGADIGGTDTGGTDS
jgi:hypothetical protein